MDITDFEYCEFTVFILQEEKLHFLSFQNEWHPPNLQKFGGGFLKKFGYI